ncbi:MAG TPA: outer membrane lipoprotein chaperone LolA [Candidatus Binatia bacterium]|jgi:chaperone LolA|nr:outer membrane lipoprotein chaperone LolA [Candidatus Binatia bacterium]
MPRPLLAVLLLLTATAHADVRTDAVTRLQQRYDKTDTLQADFSQTVESATLAGTLESTGTVAFAKPNRMRWDYLSPEPQLIVGDGESLWIYQPDLKQVIKAPLKDAFQSTTPVTFLAGLGQVERDFDVSLEKDESEQWVLKLVPKKKGQGIGDMILGVRKSDASVAEARITDPAGTTTRIRFSNEKLNAPVAEDRFHFTPPPGVDVVKPPTY